MGESAAKYRPEIDLDEFERRLRAAAPAPASRPVPAQGGNPVGNAADPLAELARLLGSEGGTNKEDPFEALFRAQAAIEEIRQAPSPVRAQPEPVQPPQHEPYFDPRAEAQARPVHADPAGHHAAEPLPYHEAEPEWRPEAQQAADGWDGHYDEFPPQAPPPAGRRRVIYGMAAVLLAGVAAIGVTLAMRAKSGGQEVVTIQADSDPARIKPEQADNAPAANAQTLFDRKDNGNVAKVVAKQEQPADLGATVKSARVVGGAAGVPTPPPPAAAGQASQGEGVFPTPKKVKTVSVRADGSVIDGPDARPQLARNPVPTMAAGGFPSTAPVANGAPAKPAPVKTPATTKSTERAATSTTEAALKAPTTRPQTAAKPAAPTKSASAAEHAGETGGFAVQLAGSPVEAEARAAANTLSAKYAGPLQGRHATFVEAKVGDKTVYRVRVGHLTEEGAKSMCTAIKGQGGSCFVAKN
jgi:hypothetical protein